MPKLSSPEIKKIVSTAKELGSYRKASLELGYTQDIVTKYCKMAGVIFLSPKEKSKSRKMLLIDGFKFYWKLKGYYYGITDRGRESASRYLYRKVYDKEKPTNMVIMFKDGNRENYDLNNIYFMSRNEWGFKNAITNRQRCIESLEKGRKKFYEMVKSKPHLLRQRNKRMWSTRRLIDPENESAKKGAATRKKNAMERGYYFSKKSIQRMSDAHKGLTRRDSELRKLGMEQMAIRKKLGML